MESYIVTADNPCGTGAKIGDTFEVQNEGGFPVLYINGVKTCYGFYFDTSCMEKLSAKAVFDLAYSKALKKYKNGQRCQCVINGQVSELCGPTHAGIKGDPLFTTNDHQIWGYVNRLSNICIYKEGIWATIISAPEEDDPWGKVTKAPVEDGCEDCNGTGRTLSARLYPSGHTEVDVECPTCEGTGERKVTTVEEVIALDGYVKVTEAGRYEGVAYEVGEIWKVESLSDVGTLKSSGIFVINNAGTRCQFGLCECEYLGMHLDKINQHFYSLNNSQKNQSNGRDNTTNGSLRTVAPQIGQGKGRLESRVQSRKSQVKLAECDLVNQGSVSYGKTEGRGLKGCVPFRLPSNS